jgi:hypothetical protein
MVSKKFILAEIMVLGSIGYFFFWAFIWQIVIWNKPLIDALKASYGNWILLSIFVVAQIYLLKRGKGKESLFTINSSHKKSSHKKNEDNPWLEKKSKLVNPHEDSKTDFLPIHILKRLLGSMGEKFGGGLNGLGHSKIHLRFLHTAKRIYFSMLFMLYLLLALVSFGSPLFFIIFVSSAYLALDYLWKTRGYLWRKREEE